MPCRKTATYNGATGSGKPSGGGFATEAECLQACQEGACCEGTTCSVKPQCQCQGAGKVFKGVGTVCSPNPCAKTTCQGFDLCGWCPSPCPQEIQLRLSNCTDTDYGSGFESMNGTYSLALQPVVPGLGVRFYSITLPGFKSVTLRFSCIGNATGYAMSCTATANTVFSCEANGASVHPFTSCCARESFASNNGTGFLFSYQGARNPAALSFTAEVMC